MNGLGLELRIIFLTMGAAFLLSLMIGPLFIPVLRRLKFGQQIREEGPQGHKKKAGTPTMGGTIILLALVMTIWKFADKTIELYLIIFATLGYGLIGFLDDYIKIAMRRLLGLTARQKLFGQLLIAGILYYFLIINGFSTAIAVPGTNWELQLGIFYLPFILLLLLSVSNAVNLTDGLDGLLAGTAAVAFGAYAIIALLIGNQPETVIFAAAMIGALLGFLIFNAHPARVFMGDTGSLAIGGALGALAIITKTELLLIVIGGVFVIETLSVIIQVISFQMRGKRIFRMSPLHHHFELSGWSEWRVVVTFWLASILLAVLGVGLYINEGL